MLGQVVFEEDPGAANLRAGDLPGLRAPPQFLRMATQERSGFNEVKCSHGGTCADEATPAQR